VKNIHTIDFYAYESRLKGLNPGLKAVVAIAALLICIGTGNYLVSVTVFLTMGGVTVIWGGLSFWKYLGLLKIPVTFLILGTAAIVVGISSAPTGRFCVSLPGFYLYLSDDGAILSARLIIKAMACVSAMYMLVLSTPASEVINLLGKLPLPRLLLELMNLIYRFIFVMMDVQSRMKQAAQSRLGYSSFFTSCRSFGGIGANLFLVSLKKAGTYYDAMTSRCYEGELLFMEEVKPVKRKEAAVAAGYIAVLLLLLLI
jgi:cobalt/nickel transport system permease protein